MEILPKNLGTRPRLAIELRPEGVVAARAEDASAVLMAVAARALEDGVFLPSLKSGSLVDSTRIVASLRDCLEAVAARGERTRHVTLIIPDASVRVLLLEFDELPSKAEEALPIIRFRLKKLVPFDVDHALVSYQVMATENKIIRVLVVTIPSDVLAEYENAITVAGYLPGAVLSSTLAALASVEEQELPFLLVNASRGGVTSAIVRGSTLLLHRTLELALDSYADLSIPALQASGGYDRIEAEALMESAALRQQEQEQMNQREIAQAVSVAAAYYEDTLLEKPREVIAAGTLDAAELQALLNDGETAGLPLREAITTASLTADVVGRVPLGWLTGVRGALRN